MKPILFILLLVANSCLAQIGRSSIGRASIGNTTPPVAAPPVTLVQSKFGSNATASASATLTGVTSGNKIIVIAQWNASSFPSAPANGDCTDGVSGYTMDNESGTINTFYRFAVWSKSASANGNLTITVNNTGSGANWVSLCAYEVSGLPVGAYDSGNKGNGTSTSPATSTFNTAGAGIIVAIEGECSGSTVTHTAGANFSISDSGNARVDDDNNNQGGMCEHRITSGALTGTSATGTLGASVCWMIFAAAYK